MGLCKDVPGQIGVLYGIPNVLTSGSGSETHTREVFRRFVLTAIEPLARIVSVELTRVFEQPIELDLSQLAHADIAGRARAFKALVASGMPAADAARDHCNAATWTYAGACAGPMLGTGPETFMVRLRRDGDPN